MAEDGKDILNKNLNNGTNTKYLKAMWKLCSCVIVPQCRLKEKE